MNNEVEEILEGIHLKEKPEGMVLTFNGELYETIVSKVHDGSLTRAFYHHLRVFVSEISKLIES